MHRARPRARAPLPALAAVTVIALGGLGVAGTGLPVLTGTARAAYAGSEGRIAFVRGGDIYSILPSGSGLRLLAGGGHNSGPRWSPNGQRIAYTDGGDLWIMNADGSRKNQLTRVAPGQADGRPTWSPSGRYLAYVQTGQHAQVGYLTRYDTVSKAVTTFTTTRDRRLIKVPALPGSAPAWQRMGSPSPYPYFVVSESASPLCPARSYCLSGLGLGHEYQFRDVYPSIEDQTDAPMRLTDPDWFPLHPNYATDVMTTVESCTATGCAHSGILPTIVGSVILPGAYQAVYSPTGDHIAFVRGLRGTPEIFTKVGTGPASAVPLTAGTEPDWQPEAPFPPA